MTRQSESVDGSENWGVGYSNGVAKSMVFHLKNAQRAFRSF